MIQLWKIGGNASWGESYSSRITGHSLDLIILHGGAEHTPGLPKKLKKLVKGIHLPFGSWGRTHKLGSFQASLIAAKMEPNKCLWIMMFWQRWRWTLQKPTCQPPKFRPIPHSWYPYPHSNMYPTLPAAFKKPLPVIGRIAWKYVHSLPNPWLAMRRWSINDISMWCQGFQMQK